MAFKFIVFAAFVAVANAGGIQYAAPAAHLSYAAPAAHLSYAAPAAHVSYAAPAAHVSYAAPVAHAAPLAYAHAPAVGYAKVAAPVAYAAKAVVAEDYDHNPQYSYAYDIQDALTGDSKSQHETRSGDHVTGSYSVVDPDGTKRTVEYTADPHNGFNAVVHREPLGVAVKTVAPVAKYAAPVGYAAPVHNYAAPLAYAAPVAKYAAAPLAYHAAPAKYYH